MAQRTGNTIADARPLRDSRIDRRSVATLIQPNRLDRSLLTVLCILAWSLFGVLHAAQPGSKSRTSTGNPSRTSANKQGSGGLFGLRSMFGSKSSDRNANFKAKLEDLPLDRLTPDAQAKILAIAQKPTLYRRLPTQAIRCDRDLFLFLTRKPETIIGMWDLMGITHVQAKRIAPYQLDAIDGSGTTCRIDLLYGDPQLHIYFADGMYDGKFAQKPITGKGIFIFRSSYARASDGGTTVNGTLDCFVKFDSLGADLIARSLGGIIGKSADHNFIETAKFMNQVSHACESNPEGMLAMADALPQVDPQTKAQFARVIATVSRRGLARMEAIEGERSARLVRPTGIRETN